MVDNLIPAEVVAHEIGIFGEVDGFKRESTEPLTAVHRFRLGGGGTSRTGFGAPVSIHGSLDSPFGFLLLFVRVSSWGFSRLQSYKLYC